MIEKTVKWVKSLSKKGRLILASAIGVGLIGASTYAEPSTPVAPIVEPVPVADTKKEIEPATTTETVTKTEKVLFGKTTKNDADLKVGEKSVTTLGVNGIKTHTYKVTKVDGKETARKLIKTEVTKKAISQVTSVGTKKPYVAPKPKSSNCDSNYSGACVPIASDVDCAGGSGNGPAYVSGPVYIGGYDPYDLDRDGDGIACER